MKPLVSLKKNKTPNYHAIVIDDPDPTSNATVTLPLSFSGVPYYLLVHKPSLEDWDSGKYTRYELISENLDWNPSDPTFGKQENDATDDVDSFVDRYAPAGDPNLYIRAISSSVPQAEISDDDNLGNLLINKVQVSAIARDISTVQTTKTGNVTSTQGKSVDAHNLARRWMIPIDRVKRNVKKTSQRGIKKILHPGSSIRRLTNNIML